ncbi:Uncharacterised protein [Mycobacteroides abscessus subsp. massiliense]|nr:Uncharacterised protein [Mycobacteroides abscessus subsp. massiliense]
MVQPFCQCQLQLLQKRRKRFGARLPASDRDHINKVSDDRFKLSLRTPHRRHADDDIFLIRILIEQSFKNSEIHNGFIDIIFLGANFNLPVQFIRKQALIRLPPARLDR